MLAQFEAAIPDLHAQKEQLEDQLEKTRKLIKSYEQISTMLMGLTGQSAGPKQPTAGNSGSQVRRRIIAIEDLLKGGPQPISVIAEHCAGRGLLDDVDHPESAVEYAMSKALERFERYDRGLWRLLPAA